MVLSIVCSTLLPKFLYSVSCIWLKALYNAAQLQYLLLLTFANVLSTSWKSKQHPCLQPSSFSLFCQLCSVLFKSKQVRFLTSPSPPPPSTSPETGGQVGSSAASRYDSRCSVNQNSGIKIFRITWKSFACGWDANLVNSESSGWNGIQGKSVHTHPVYLHLWKLSWIKQAFFTALAPELALLKTNFSRWEGSDVFAKKAEPPGSLKGRPGAPAVHPFCRREDVVAKL